MTPSTVSVIDCDAERPATVAVAGAEIVTPVR
jgi:hypothetical protein